MNSKKYEIKVLETNFCAFFFFLTAFHPIGVIIILHLYALLMPNNFHDCLLFSEASLPSHIQHWNYIVADTGQGIIYLCQKWNKLIKNKQTVTWMLPYYIHSPNYWKCSVSLQVFLSTGDKNGSTSSTDEITDKAGQITQYSHSKTNNVSFW